MSFFNFNEPVNGNFASGSAEPLPDNTDVLAAPDEGKWDEYDGDKYISLRWSVIAPKEYKGRKIFQKIRVMDNDSKKAEKARRMLAAIDANAGGKLMKANEEPTDKSLTMSLVNKPMVLKIRVWTITAEQSNDGQERKGNWIAAVSPRKSSEPVELVAVPEEKAESADDDFEPDVPF